MYTATQVFRNHPKLNSHLVVFTKTGSTLPSWNWALTNIDAAALTDTQIAQQALDALTTYITAHPEDA